MKYNRDLAKLADLFHVSRTKWTIHRSGQCVRTKEKGGMTR